MITKKLNNLQVLRAFAALSVVLYHTIATAGNYGFRVNYLRFIEGWGLCGVDIFFVLSGFIMVYVLKDKNSSPIIFFVDRFARIAPMYYLVSLAMFLTLIVFTPVASDLVGVTKHFVVSILFMSNQLLGKMPILSDGWTLEFEMIFYTIMALGLFFSNKITNYVFVVSTISFFIIFIGMNSIAFEFALGVLCANIFINAKKKSGLHLIALVAGISWFICTIFLDLSHETLNQHRVLLFGIPSFLTIYGLIGIEQIKTGALTVLGDASYSIYLIQVFTITVFYKLLGRIHTTDAINDFWVLLSLVVTIIAGVLIFLIVEKPLTKIVRKRLTTKVLKERTIM